MAIIRFLESTTFQPFWINAYPTPEPAPKQSREKFEEGKTYLVPVIKDGKPATWKAGAFTLKKMFAPFPIKRRYIRSRSQMLARLARQR